MQHSSHMLENKQLIESYQIIAKVIYPLAFDVNTEVICNQKFRTFSFQSFKQLLFYHSQQNYQLSLFPSNINLHLHQNHVLIVIHGMLN